MSVLGKIKFPGFLANFPGNMKKITREFPGKREGNPSYIHGRDTCL
jgi:hypothetical protein